MVDLHCCPVLRSDAIVSIADEAIELAIEDQVFTVSGPSPALLRHALTAMNGALTVTALARLSGLPQATLQQVIGQLLEQGALALPDADASDDGGWEPEQFGALCRRLNDSWKQRLFSHPLWTGLAAGNLPRSVFIGWVVESMWFIDGVMDRLPMAIAFAHDRATRAIFSKHFAEEWDHFRFFTHALDSLGVDAAQRQLGRPLPATAAVQHAMRAAARQDPLYYAVCSGFLESTGKDRLAASEFFRQVGRSYDNTGSDGGGGAVRPMAAHVALDEEYGHGGFVDKFLAHSGKLDPARAGAALQHGYGLVETLEMWSTDIMRHYQAADALPLRTLRNYRRGAA